MPDDLAVTEASSGGDTGSATSPQSEDERIKGLQRAVSAKAQEADEARKRAAALEARLEALELAQMSESERSGFLTAKEKNQLAALQAENERLKLAQKYPDVAPHYEALISAKTADEQAQILQRILRPQQPGAQAEPVSDIDPNNPMRSPTDPISLPVGTINDLVSADRILNLWGNRPTRV